MQESEHHLVTALSVESSLGVLQLVQKHIRGWKVGLEAEMGFPVSEACSLPRNAKSLMGSIMTILCGSHYPLRMAMVESVQPEGGNRENFLGAQVRTLGANVTSFASVVTKDGGSGAREPSGGLE